MSSLLKIYFTVMVSNFELSSFNYLALYLKSFFSFSFFKITKILPQKKYTFPPPIEIVFRTEVSGEFQFHPPLHLQMGGVLHHDKQQPPPVPPHMAALLHHVPCQAHSWHPVSFGSMPSLVTLQICSDSIFNFSLRTRLSYQSLPM